MPREMLSPVLLPARLWLVDERLADTWLLLLLVWGYLPAEGGETQPKCPHGIFCALMKMFVQV